VTGIEPEWYYRLILQKYGGWEGFVANTFALWRKMDTEVWIESGEIEELGHA